MRSLTWYELFSSWIHSWSYWSEWQNQPLAPPRCLNIRELPAGRELGTLTAGRLNPQLQERNRHCLGVKYLAQGGEGFGSQHWIPYLVEQFHQNPRGSGVATAFGRLFAVSLPGHGWRVNSARGAARRRFVWAVSAESSWQLMWVTVAPSPGKRCVWHRTPQ